MLYINKMRFTYFILLVLGIFCLTLAAEAKMVSYIDKNGEMHYVNTEFSKVPAEYRHQVEDEVTEAVANQIVSPENTPKGSTPTGSTVENTPLVVEVLISLDCPDCKKLESLLTSHRVEYRRYNVDSHPYGKELYETIGGGNLPITKIGDKIIYGSDIKQIVSTLKESKEKSLSSGQLQKPQNDLPEPAQGEAPDAP